MEEKQKVNKGAERPLVGIVCNIKNDENDESQGEFDEPGTVSALSLAQAQSENTIYKTSSKQIKRFFIKSTP